MIETIIINDRLTWTCFRDDHTGSRGQKTPFTFVYIQAEGLMAEQVFIDRLKIYPSHQSCHCCGPDFGTEVGSDGLAELTKWARNVEIHDGVEQPLDPDQEQVRLTDYCLRDDVLVIYTRTRGEEI